jgi:hypothetical protein
VVRARNDIHTPTGGVLFGGMKSDVKGGRKGAREGGAGYVVTRVEGSEEEKTEKCWTMARAWTHALLLLLTVERLHEALQSGDGCPHIPRGLPRLFVVRCHRKACGCRGCELRVEVPDCGENHVRHCPSV